MQREKFGSKTLNIKKMTFKDLEDVYEIEKLSNPTPWSQTSFSDCLKGFYQNLIITLDSDTVAFCIMTINFTESHLLNISVHPNYRHKGIGEILLKIIFSNIIAIFIFYFLINLLESSLVYVNNYKFIFIVLIVLSTFVSYIGISIIIKAFKISDINLKY